jgi:hypothetical protein
MGYMGFGMQKWIYTQKPRKVFENSKNHETRKLKGKERINASERYANDALSDIMIQKRLRRTRLKSIFLKF